MATSALRKQEDALGLMPFDVARLNPQPEPSRSGAAVLHARRSMSFPESCSSTVEALQAHPGASRSTRNSCNKCFDEPLVSEP